MFTSEELEWVRSVTLWDIIVNSTDVDPATIQRQVFFWNDGDPCPQPGQIEPSTLEPCSYLKGFDYFEVSDKRAFGNPVGIERTTRRANIVRLRDV